MLAKCAVQEPDFYLGLLTPITDALWHNAGSVFVVVNAAMLLRKCR